MKTDTAAPSPIAVRPTAQSKLASVDFNDIPFGKTFSDHMFLMEYSGGLWRNPRIEPFGPIPMHPANSGIHYGQSIFEGMKAYRNAEGQPLLFRPDQNIERFNRSAERMAMPTVPPELFMQALRELVLLDSNWIPDRPGSSLYIRPLMYAIDDFIGIRVAENYRMVIMTSPASIYYPKPVEVLVAQHYDRAFKGGTGFAKTAGNYGATMLPLRMARERGFDQVLWVDGVEFQAIQEIGTMNVFFVFKDKVVTPPTNEGTILLGVTRDSAITLLRDRGIPVVEERITVNEVVAAYDSGDLLEVFGTGTAATIAQIGRLGYQDRNLTFDDSRWTLSSSIKAELAELRTGRIPDRFGWNVVLA
jgi:branched-chain amino acid aminotransferase